MPLHLNMLFITRHMFFTKQDRQDEIARNVDRYSDSYARDVTVAELKEVPFACRCILPKFAGNWFSSS